jgi:hypothetical protein
MNESISWLFFIIHIKNNLYCQWALLVSRKQKLNTIKTNEKKIMTTIYNHIKLNLYKIKVKKSENCAMFRNRHLYTQKSLRFPVSLLINKMQFVE